MRLRRVFKPESWLARGHKSPVRLDLYPRTGIGVPHNSHATVTHARNRPAKRRFRHDVRLACVSLWYPEACVCVPVSVLAPDTGHRPPRTDLSHHEPAYGRIRVDIDRSWCQAAKSHVFAPKLEHMETWHTHNSHQQSTQQ